MDFLRAKCTEIPPITPVNLSHATFLITGANAGIGLEIAREILNSQPKRLILAVRSVERGQSAASELAQAMRPGTKIDVMKLDQSSFASIKTFADELRGQRVDIAILNAGTWSSGFSRTTDGFETDLHVNVLGSALLSLLLLPNLQIAAAAPVPSTIRPHLTFVSSGLHARAKFADRGLPAGQIMAALNNENTYDGQDRYPTSKLLSLLWAKELAKQTGNGEIVINSANPGFCRTSLLRDISGVAKYFSMASSKLLGRSPEEGATCILHAVVGQSEDSHGRYLSEGLIKDEVLSARGFEGEQLAKRIWDEVLGIFKHYGVLN